MENEPMDIDEYEVYKFDDLLNDRIKLNDVNNLLRNEENVFDNSQNRYENKGGTFLTGIDIFSEEEKQKKEERAKRFGLPNQTNDLPGEKGDLYSSLGVDENSENTKNLRLSVIHMRGTDEMSTKDVFKYFEHYAPSAIEWINDMSCNVVWLDPISAARALKSLSKKIVGFKYDSEKEEKNDEDSCMIEIIDDNNLSSETESTIHIKDIKYPLPRGLWRKGVDCQKSKNIFLRFATYADKKPINAEKMSNYYKKYGNPNFGGERGIISKSRKRVYKQVHNKEHIDKNSKGNGATKSLKNPWGDLSHSWGLYDTIERDFINPSITPQRKIITNVRRRLGTKITKPEREATPPESDHSNSKDCDSDSDNAWHGRNKTLRMRMHADDEEIKIKKKRANTSSSHNEMIQDNDLRSKIRNKRGNLAYKEAIQIVVMNPRALKKELSENESEAEEGEISDSSDSNKAEHGEEEYEGDDCVVEIEDEEEEVEDNNSDNEVDSDSSSNSSDISEKEIQGPKGSVVKVVPKQKPKLASTVWAKLNQGSEVNKKKREIVQRSNVKDLRETIKGDLRSRIRNSIRGRSPLRIEVRNDKCA